MAPFLALVPCGSGSGPGPGRDVLEGLVQRIAVGAEHLLVEIGRDADAAPGKFMSLGRQARTLHASVGRIGCRTTRPRSTRVCSTLEVIIRSAPA